MCRKNEAIRSSSPIYRRPNHVNSKNNPGRHCRRRDDSGGEIPKSLAPDADGPGGVNREMMQWVIEIIKGKPGEEKESL